ncbi:hypothetical protein DY000_02042906 [Brassica cretica]|uniref:Aspartic peptidase DDI1-type domain-containing protein n=1 Tax=Brassica cretica TaxID=69181 RepID=A0ABQ7BR09_BRACR|nr:hypothetical protein DY000_02042906 [Brassica cretica]
MWEEDAFLVESSMYVGSSYWCRPIPSDKPQLTPLFGSDKTVRIQSHSDFAARHPHPPTLVCIRPNDVDRQQAERIDRQHHERIDRQENGSIDRQEQQRIDRFPSTPYRQTEDATEKENSTLAETSLVEIDQHQRDGYEHVMEVQPTKEGVQREKVKRVPKDMSFVDAYYKYRLGNFFRESRETYEDIEQLFNKVCRKPKRTLKKEQDPRKFLIPCSIQNHDLPNALCDTGSVVSIMSIDTADLLGLKMESSQDSFTFVDNSNANSAGMIRNVKVEIGDCTIPVDLHVLEIKSGKPSSLLFGRAFMATVGAVCDLNKNMMCLTNIDEGVYYDPVDKTRSKDFISCRELSGDEAHTADSTREPAKPKSASIDNQPSASVDMQPSESIDTKLPASVLGKDLKKMSSHKNRRVLHQHQPTLDHCQSTEHHKYRSPLNCVDQYSNQWQSFELAFQFHRSHVNHHHVEKVMPVLLKRGQSASREEAAEKRKPRQSMQHSARR